MEPAVQSINSAVQGMYEAFPYPDYSLFIPLRWQEAYASGSLFARRLAENAWGSAPATANQRILVAGCGDVQAAILSRWEPRSHRIVGIDLSRPSLQKARLRSWMMLRPMDLWMKNLEEPGVDLGAPYVHIDAYGMLHHLANPAQGLKTLRNQLLPGGTMRIMVYNSRARQWMFQIARVFSLLGLSAYERADLREAAQLLGLFARTLPALQERLDAMQGIIQQPARLVDAFFHEREARLGLGYWLEAIRDADLKILGLFDRYAELDDLANPLLKMPAADDLQVRIDDLRFENNLELYLCAPGVPTCDRESRAAPLSLRRKMPPVAWVRYNETRKIGSLKLWQLWQAFLTRNFQGQSAPLDRWALRLPPESLQRLSRLGALFPDQFQSRDLQKTLMAPMQAVMDIPEFPAPISLIQSQELQRRMEQILVQKRLPLARLNLIGERLLRAQKL